MGAPTQVNHIINHIWCPFLVGLNHKANPVPAVKFAVVAKGFQQVQRQLQAVGFLGVNV